MLVERGQAAAAAARVAEGYRRAFARDPTVLVPVTT